MTNMNAVATQTIELPIGRRYASIVPSIKKSVPIVDPETRTCRLSFSSELPQERFDWDMWEVYDEVLSHDPGAANLDRCNTNACPLLWNHDRNDQRGITVEASIEPDRRAYATVRFSRSAAGEQLMQDVNDGIVTGVSFAYRVYAMELTKKAVPPARNTYTATSWEVVEISFCSIPADPTVGPGKSAAELGAANTVVVKGESATQTVPRPGRKSQVSPKKTADDSPVRLAIRARRSQADAEVPVGEEVVQTPQLDPLADSPVEPGTVVSVNDTGILRPLDAEPEVSTELSQTNGVDSMTTNHEAATGERSAPEDRPIEELSAKVQLEQEQAQRKALEKRLAALEIEQTYGLKCSRQQKRAQLLRVAGKLSPAMEKALFGCDDDVPVEVYKSHQGCDPVEFLLDVIEKHGSQLVDFKSFVTSFTPLPDPPQEPQEAPETKAAAIYGRLKDQGGFNRNS